MSEEYGVRVLCDGCGEKSEWASPDPFGCAIGDLRVTLTRRGWGRSDMGRDLCPLCVRCDRQRGRLAPEPAGGGS